MRIKRVAAVAAVGALPGARPGRLRRRRRRARAPVPAASPSPPAAPWRSCNKAPEDQGRHQVRPAGLRPEGPVRQAGGLRRRDRQDHRQGARHPRRQDRVGRDALEVREDVIEQGTVDLVVGDLHDQRQAQGADRLRRPVLRWPARTSWSRRTTPPSPGRTRFKDGTKKVCSVTGSTPAEEIKKYLKDVGTQLVLFDTYAKCVDAAQERPGRRRHHRQRDPARLRRRGRGVVQAGRRATSPRSRTASA